MLCWVLPRGTLAGHCLRRNYLDLPAGDRPTVRDCFFVCGDNGTGRHGDDTFLSSVWRNGPRTVLQFLNYLSARTFTALEVGRSRPDIPAGLLQQVR